MIKSQQAVSPVAQKVSNLRCKILGAILASPVKSGIVRTGIEAGLMAGGAEISEGNEFSCPQGENRKNHLRR